MKNIVSVFTIVGLLVGAGAVSADHHEVTEKIRALEKKWEAAANAGDAAAVAALYSEDAVSFPPKAPMAKGRAAIQASMEEEFAAKKWVTQTIETIEVIPHGDYATETGKWIAKHGDGSVESEGAFVALWKNVGGEWKIHRETFNFTKESTPVLITELKPLEYFIGDWNYRVENPDGSVSEGTMTCSVGNDGHSILRDAA